MVVVWADGGRGACCHAFGVTKHEAPGWAEYRGYSTVHLQQEIHRKIVP